MSLALITIKSIVRANERNKRFTRGAALLTELNVMLLFRNNFMFLRKSTQNTRESIVQWVKNATSSSCLVLVSCLTHELTKRRLRAKYEHRTSIRTLNELVKLIYLPNF